MPYPNADPWNQMGGRGQSAPQQGPSYGMDQVDPAYTGGPGAPPGTATNWTLVGNAPPGSAINNPPQANDRGWQNYFQTGYGAAGRRPGIANSADLTSNQDQSRQAQQALIQQLQGIAQGGNSPAMDAFNSAYGQARGNAMSGASMTRNVGAGAAMRGGQMQQQGLSAQQNAQAPILQMQQQKAARDALMALQDQQRQQDMALANMHSAAALRNQGANQHLQQGMMSGGTSYGAGQTSQNVNGALTQMGILNGQSGINGNFTNQLLGMGAGAVGTGMSAFGGGGFNNAPGGPGGGAPAWNAGPMSSPGDWNSYPGSSNPIDNAFNGG